MNVKNIFYYFLKKVHYSERILMELKFILMIVIFKMLHFEKLIFKMLN